MTVSGLKRTKQTRAYNANVHHVLHGFTEPSRADGAFPWGRIDHVHIHRRVYRRLYSLITEQGDWVHDTQTATEADRTRPR